MIEQVEINQTYSLSLNTTADFKLNGIKMYYEKTQRFVWELSSD